VVRKTSIFYIIICILYLCITSADHD